MPVVKKVDFSGNVIGDLELSKDIFEVPIHEAAIHQVVVAHLANLRLGTHDTKDRGDVRGGGRKPWRQKHTGRARAGSNRSPVWVGGGVAHGPHPKSYAQKVNKKVRRLALKSVLSMKVQENDMVVIDRFDLDAPKTKKMLEFLEKIDGTTKPLILMHETDSCVYRSASNIPGAQVLNVDSINVYDIINHRKLIATPEAVKKIEEVFGA